MTKRRFALVGCGSRHKMFMKAITDVYSDSCELVALCDNNEGRLKLSARTHLGDENSLPLYDEKSFDEMVKKTRPDTVVVTTRDCFHDKYIIRAMELGCDAITEKPMTIDEVRCQRILDTMNKTGRDLRVTFNYRYSPPRTQVKDLLMSGAVGRVLSVDFHWLLDTRHGADYFRRWHRHKDNSGGLMVHKATHHFDLVNWWLSSIPETVYATGSRRFYTPDTAIRYGLENRSERCLDCQEKDKCRFFMDIHKPGVQELYLENEGFDGYLRDRCVFSEDMDIEDSMSLTVKYGSGATLSYSLNAFCPKEGYVVCFNGTKGRLEHTTLETSYVSGESGSQVHETIRQGSSIWIFPHFSEPRQEELWTGTGGHGGGDSPLLNSLFSLEPTEDKYLRAAGVMAGAWSILTGISANRSMRTGRVVKVPSLVKGLDEPDYPDMPEW